MQGSRCKVQGARGHKLKLVAAPLLRQSDYDMFESASLFRASAYSGSPPYAQSPSAGLSIRSDK